jgi:hypothetical protein
MKVRCAVCPLREGNGKSQTPKRES